MSEQASNNVPDSVSMEDLIALSSTAQAEEEAQKLTGPFAGLNRDQLIELCSDTEQAMTEKCPHPMATKQLINHRLDRLLAWHMGAAERLNEQGEDRAAAGWSRDAGKIQAAWNILCTIEVCDDDFLNE